MEGEYTQVPISTTDAEVLTVPVTQEYHGPAACESRALSQYAQEIRSGTGLNVYAEIKAAIRRAREAGRAEVIFLDLGCGEEWRAFNSIIPSSRVETIKYYAQDDEDTVEELMEIQRITEVLQQQKMGFVVIGLTDAQEGHHNEVLMDQKEDGYRIKKVGYTLAPGQTLNDFLAEHVLTEYTGIDMVTAVQVFEYLRPGVFEDTLRAAAGGLHPGGKMIAVGIDPAYKHQETGGLAPHSAYTPEEIAARKKVVTSSASADMMVEVFDHGKPEIRGGANYYNSFVIEKKPPSTAEEIETVNIGNSTSS